MSGCSALDVMQVLSRIVLYTFKRYSTKLHSASSSYNFLAGLSNFVAHSTRKQSCCFARSATCMIIWRPYPCPRTSGSMNKSGTRISHQTEWPCRGRTLKEDLTIEVHDGLLTPWRLMRVEMRNTKELPLFRRIIGGSEDQTMQVFSRIYQAIESTLILCFGKGCSVEVDVCSKEC